MPILRVANKNKKSWKGELSNYKIYIKDYLTNILSKQKLCLYKFNKKTTTLSPYKHKYKHLNIKRRFLQ